MAKLQRKKISMDGNTAALDLNGLPTLGIDYR